MTGNENRIDDQNLCIEVQSEIINTNNDSTAIENLLMTGNENKIDESSETYLEIPVYSCTLIDGSEIAITECENISGDLMDTSTASTNNEYTQMVSDSKGNNHVESSGILYSVIPKSVDNIDHQNVCIRDESENIFNTANESSAMENSLMVAENNDSFVIFDCRVKDPDWIPCEDDSDADNNQNIEGDRTEEQANQNIEGDRTEEQANQNIEGDRTEEQSNQNIEEEQDAAPVRRKRNRWMVADPSSWQRNLAKKKRNMGETYTVKRKGEVNRLSESLIKVETRTATLMHLSPALERQKIAESIKSISKKVEEIKPRSKPSYAEMLQLPSKVKTRTDGGKPVRIQPKEEVIIIKHAEVKGDEKEAS
ncbi:uncharacterized protein LOC120352167 [Nilaparvata lugens]|uniref:uncharacterized protein LOC120352167 n=1 Tax=Nilaparvata lugens TaxID=108931 RepID=UPI00193EBA25|nr:uncharacterized protein LOC120352167 [Nilaparvata lugens]